MCILISDLFDDPEQIQRGLRHLRFMGQDTLVVCVADPMELDFRGSADYRMRDLETGQEMMLDSETASRYFNRGFSEHHARLGSICRELKIDFEVVTTAEPFSKSLLRVMEKRRRLF